MRYFQISADERNPQPRFLDWYRILKPVKWQDAEVYRAIENKSCFQVELDREIRFLDVISHPQFMVSKEMANLIHSYAPEIRFKSVVLLETESKRSAAYRIPALPEVDGLSEESILNRDRSVIREGILRYERIKRHPIFKLSNVNGRYIVADLEFVESAYRRKVTGMNLREFMVR